MLAARCWMFDAGYSMLDTEYGMLDTGCRLLISGHRFLVAEMANSGSDLLMHDFFLYSYHNTITLHGFSQWVFLWQSKTLYQDLSASASVLLPMKIWIDQPNGMKCRAYFSGRNLFHQGPRVSACRVKFYPVKPFFALCLSWAFHFRACRSICC